MPAERAPKCARGWLLAFAAAGAAAFAGTPAPEPTAARTPTPPPPRTADAPPQAAAPDDGLIEFLGDDDVPDPKWWEFMKRNAPAAPSARPAPQDSQR